MDINIINDMIKEFEADDITLSNVRNLSALYICRDSLQKSLTESYNASNSTSNNNVEKELKDIFPAYRKYQELKRKYQLKEVSEDGLPDAMKFVTQEIYEFILTLYNSTHLRKERKVIEDMILAFDKAINMSYNV